VYLSPTNEISVPINVRGLILTKVTTIKEKQFNEHQCILFAHCPLVKVIEPQGFRFCRSMRRFYSKILEEVGVEAFFGCLSLVEVSMDNVHTLGKSSFKCC
jgi:hypothetical protein